MMENPYPTRTPGWWAWTRVINTGFLAKSVSETQLKKIIDASLRAQGIYSALPQRIRVDRIGKVGER